MKNLIPETAAGWFLDSPPPLYPHTARLPSTAVLSPLRNDPNGDESFALPLIEETALHSAIPAGALQVGEIRGWRAWRVVAWDGKRGYWMNDQLMLALANGYCETVVVETAPDVRSALHDTVELRQVRLVPRIASVAVEKVWMPGVTVRGKPRCRLEEATAWAGVYGLKAPPAPHNFISGWSVIGEVDLWGEVVEHDWGWRAEFGMPVSLHAPLYHFERRFLHAWDWILDQLRMDYGLPPGGFIKPGPTL